MSKKTYVICTFTNINLSDVIKGKETVVDYFNRGILMDLVMLSDIGVGFYVPDKHGYLSNDYINYYNSNIVAKYDEIDILLMDYIYRGRGMEVTKEVAIDILQTLIGYDMVFECVDDKFKMVDDKEIIRLGNEIIEEISLLDVTYMYDVDLTKHNEFNDRFNILTEYIERWVSNSLCYVDMSSTDGVEWNFDMIDTKFKYIDKLDTLSDLRKTDSGFIYSCGYDIFRNYIFRCLFEKSKVVISLAVLASELSEEDDISKVLDRTDIFKKLYCIQLAPFNNDVVDFEISIMTSKELYDVCVEVMPEVHPLHNVIYSGNGIDDVICGFDMLD